MFDQHRAYSQKEWAFVFRPLRLTIYGNILTLCFMLSAPCSLLYALCWYVRGEGNGDFNIQKISGRIQISRGF